MLTNALCNELKQIASKFIPANHLDDLTQEVFLYLLEMPKGKLEQLIEDKQIKYYFIRLCKNNYYSKTSKYHYKYRKPYERILLDVITNGKYSISKKQNTADLYFIEGEGYIEDTDLVNDILSEMYWYERELFKLYVLGDNKGRRYTYTTLSNKTKISRMSIYTTLKIVKNYVARRLKEIRANDL
tara:strand:+ start:301 stop:855 length:555 start_codon:yes stop_codon:yes gene_type:complete